MKIAFFSCHDFEKKSFESANNGYGHDICFFDVRLTAASAPLAKGAPCVCAFVNDELGNETLKALHVQGVRLLALRCTGVDHVDRKSAAELGITIVNVSDYSPYSVAEHVLALVLTLNRKTHQAHNRVREGNFSLNGLVGQELHGRTVGIVGTGRIGRTLVPIMRGFGCHVLLYDACPDKEFAELTGASYVALDELWRRSDIISLHVPSTPQTRHLVNHRAIEKMKPGVMLINTGRGALIDTQALIDGLKSGKVGQAGLDVCEGEGELFFSDHSAERRRDDFIARLVTFPNVLVTGHQGFLTEEALGDIARTTLGSVSDFERGLTPRHQVVG